jgi:hypothetical protein
MFTRKLMSLAVVCVAVMGLATAASAYTISLSPSSNSVDPLGGGSFDVLVDTAPENFTFANGTLGVSVAVSDPGVIQITSAEVFAPEFFGGFVKRWSSAPVNGLNDDGIDELLGISVETAGLDAGVTGNEDGPDGTFIFATFTYDAVGLGTAELTLAPISSRSGEFLVSGGENVAGSATFQGATVEVIPEPASLALLGIGGLALIRRRR